MAGSGTTGQRGCGASSDPGEQFVEDLVQADGDLPAGVVAAELAGVGDEDAVVGLAAGAEVPDQPASAQPLDAGDGLQAGTDAVGRAAAEVVDLPRPRLFDEALEGAGQVAGVDVVADLLAAVAVDRQRPAGQVQSG